MITVSHDRYFLDRVVDRIFAFEGDGIITQYEGDYTTYMEKAIAKGTFFQDMALEDTFGQDNEKKENNTNSKDTWKNNRTKKLKFPYQEQREFESIDDDIAQLEEEISKTELEMAEVASQYFKLQELAARKEELEQQLAIKMERWVYLNDLAEQIEKQNTEK